jgi:hypothetical protein
MRYTHGSVSERDPSFQRSSFDRDFWLGQCEGFRVVSPVGRRVGIVEGLVFTRGDRPQALSIRTGLFGRQRRTIAVDEIAEIRPRRKLIVMRE